MDIDLETVLIQLGDLPNDLAAGSFKVIPPSPEVLRHDRAVEQEIVSRDGKLAGAVRVYLFRSKFERDSAYNLMSLAESQEGIKPYTLSPVGDFASAYYTDIGELVVVFVRCRAVVVIRLKSAGDYALSEDDAMHYAQQLDTRLESAVCP